MRRRIFYSDNGTLTDWTSVLNRYDSSTVTFSLVAAEDYIYIGSYYPFNHIYIKTDGTNVNSESATISAIDYWDGEDWESTVEVIDETESGGATLAQDGYITWVTDKDEGWQRDNTNYASATITGLDSITVYDMYWIRITFSADLSASMQLQWTGQLFCTDDDLEGEFPEFAESSLKTSWESGKTDWEEQRVKASELIIQKMKAKNMIKNENQIIIKEDLAAATVQKTAEVIFRGMGDDYNDNRDEAKKESAIRLNESFPIIDLDKNARGDYYETGTRVGLLSK